VAGDWIFTVDTVQTLAALSAADGRVAWVSALTRWTEPDKKRGPVMWHGPVLANGKLLLAGSMSRLLAVRAADGGKIGAVDLPGAASLAPVVAAGLCFVITDDGSLTAFR
jgi:outer membrane protein assembly factor BamB